MHRADAPFIGEWWEARLMSTNILEERLSELEKRVRRIEERSGVSCEENAPWWRKIAGRFRDNPEFDEAMRLGREYRESLRPDEPESA
jgi:hypothetical protein